MKKLESSLENLISSFIIPEITYIFPMQPSWEKTPEGEKFLQIIETTSGLEIYDDENLHYLENGGRALSRNILARWMAERALIVGAKQTIEDVKTHISNNVFQTYHIMLLTGLPIEKDYDLGQDIKLIHPGSIPNLHLRKNIAIYESSGLPNHRISSVLISPCEHQKTIKTQKNIFISGSRSAQNQNTVWKNLENARLCLSLSRNYGSGLQALGSTTITTDDVPVLSWGMGWSLPLNYRNPTIAPSLIPIEANNAKRILEKFQGLDEKNQKHLKIPLQKLNEFSAGNDVIQCAIDLRTAIESLLLSDNVQGEFRFRLSLRASLILGGNLEERRRNAKIFKKAYDICSSAVHSGRIGSKYKDARKVLEETASMARRILIYMIDNPDVDWLSLELVGEQQANNDPQE